ncbi:hypothetical protein LCGC14_3064690 [marine sediment metagenome]|uniref:Uncharacterized protein n=1 Tax=marine sediment metagenome TaxID=412755 RepID=A0A0F8WHV6_9ZZZZ
MPYIKKEDRQDYNKDLQHLMANLAKQGWKVGDVTYAMYCIVQHWFCDNPGYQTIALIRGMLAGVLSEFDRWYGFPYEDRKIRDNGSVRVTDIERELVQQGKLTYHVCPCCAHELVVKG